MEQNKGETPRRLTCCTTAPCSNRKLHTSIFPRPAAAVKAAEERRTNNGVSGGGGGKGDSFTDWVEVKVLMLALLRKTEAVNGE